MVDVLNQDLPVAESFFADLAYERLHLVRLPHVLQKLAQDFMAFAADLAARVGQSRGNPVDAVVKISFSRGRRLFSGKLQRSQNFREEI